VSVISLSTKCVDGSVCQTNDAAVISAKRSSTWKRVVNGDRKGSFISHELNYGHASATSVNVVTYFVGLLIGYRLMRTRPSSLSSVYSNVLFALECASESCYVSTAVEIHAFTTVAGPEDCAIGSERGLGAVPQAGVQGQTPAGGLGACPPEVGVLMHSV